MRPLALAIILLITNTCILFAQSPPPAQKMSDSAIRQMILVNDSIITYRIVDSCLQIARDKKITPDWTAIKVLVRDRYDSIYADRTVTKACIYYYYSHDWAKCTSAYVHYICYYESNQHAMTLNNEANFVLIHSQKPEEWKIALGWSQQAIDLVRNNPDYRETYAKLLKKINGQ